VSTVACCFTAELESTAKFQFQKEAHLIYPTAYTWWAIN